MEPLETRAEARKPARTLLQSRDKAILRFIASNRFATSRAIADAFWDGNGNWNHYRRLRKLRHCGYLETLMGDRGTRIGFRVTRKGLNLLRRDGIEIPVTHGIDCRYRTTLYHDETLITIRSLFCKSASITDYLAEHEVSSLLAKKYGYVDTAGYGYKIPDALFKLTTTKNVYRVALELEIAKKTNARYEKLLKQLSFSADWDIVFFIVEREQTIAKLKFILAELRSKDLATEVSKIRNATYFIRLADFLRDGISAQFEGEGHTVSIRQFEAA